jgi:hypothetical protein
MGNSKYEITGQIKNEDGHALGDLLVEAFDSDLGSADDYLGHAFTDSQGKFLIKFETPSFKAAYDILERGPDVYLVVTDEYGVVKKTETASNVSQDDLEFGDIIVSDDQPFDDPYANSADRMIALFMSLGDTIAPSQTDFLNSFIQMMRSIRSWLYYTNERIYKLYGYPGPQVIARPKEFPDHDHSVAWRTTA